VTSRILVVDDEPDLESLVRQKFPREIRDGAMTFAFARDGVEALARLEAEPGIELVLSDINMPRMDGLALLAALRERPDPPAAVIVSAYGDMSNIRLAMNRGALDFLVKPIDLSDLEATVVKTLSHVECLRSARNRQLEAERARAALARFFSPAVALELASEDGARSLEAQRRDVTVLFTDLAGFTPLVEAISPDVLAVLLNDYWGAMTDVVFQFQGTVGKIVGDGMLVLFGAPGAQPDMAQRAVRCALALDAQAEALRERWSAQGVALGLTRIGVNLGPAIVGNFGGHDFLDYSAHGDTVNIAARLEAANKTLGTRICVSASVVGEVPGFEGRPVGDLLLRGRRNSLRAYEPRPSGRARGNADRLYEEAFAKLEAQEPGALAAFASLVGQVPDDPLANLHLRRLLNGATGTRLDLTS
jgi:class 3 adenylate cyclase